MSKFLQRLFQSAAEALRRSGVQLALLRGAGLLALLLALLDPSFLRKRPDPEAYRLEILADVSGSMRTPDADAERTRLEELRRLLGNDDEPGPVLQTLRDQNPRLGLHLFSEEVRPWTGSLPDRTAAGPTALGDALQARLRANTDSPRALGGLVLLSDGIHHQGLPPIEAARRYAAAGIPLTVIGIGKTTTTGDVAVRFARSRARVEEQSAQSAEILLGNSMEQERGGRLRVFRGEEVIADRTVRLPAGEETSVSVDYSAGRAGVETLRANFLPETPDRNPSTDTAYAVRNVYGDGRTEILFLSSRPGWEGRLLRVLAGKSSELVLKTLVRVEEERYFYRAEEESNRSSPAKKRHTYEALPLEPSFYLENDLLILDFDTLVAAPEEVRDTIRRFVATRGGGCLLLPGSGNQDVSSLPASLRNIFPVRETKPRRLAEDTPLRIDPHPLFSQEAGGSLLQSPPPVISGGTLLLLPERQSRAARQPVTLREGGEAVVSLHAYGAGRAAWLAGSFTWRWALGGETEAARYRTFTESLLGWLATGGKERMRTPVNGQLLSTAEPAELSVRLLGAGYEPRMDARVSATITSPEGSVETRRLKADLGEPGMYRARIPVPEAGAWRVDYEAAFPDGERLLRTAWFSAAPLGPEMTDVAMREQPLRDIARITGGRYLEARESGDLREIPVAANVPVRTDHFRWTRTWPFLLLALILFLLEWWLRRRRGLR